MILLGTQIKCKNLEVLLWVEIRDNLPLGLDVITLNFIGLTLLLNLVCIVSDNKVGLLSNRNICHMLNRDLENICFISDFLFCFILEDFYQQNPFC